MKKTLIILLLIGLALPSFTHASEKLLNQFFQNVDSMQARFDQQVVDEDGMTLERSSGLFYLSRPGKFRWNYDSADLEYSDIGQQIIADGEFIYMYDPDLEQVTKRSMRDALSQVPSLVLVQTGSQLDDYFNITDFGLTDGLSWVVLKPKGSEASYEQLMIGFAGQELRSIVLLDGLGNETRLQLSSVENNTNLSADTFQFNAPEGADIFAE